MQENLIIYDISMTLRNGMLCYPKDVAYQRRRQRDMAKDDSSNVSQVEMSVHTGSHIDAPVHYYPAGQGADKVPLEHLYGQVQVIDCRGTAAVTAEVLQGKLPPGSKRLLLKTDNSQKQLTEKTKFDPDFVYLAASGAKYIVEQGIILVGIDYLSIDKSGLAGKDAHHILLENNVTILEGVVLGEAPAGEYFLACGALKMEDSDGAPCRVVLIKNLP